MRTRIRPTRIQAVLLAVVLSLGAAACGQKAGVAEQAGYVVGADGQVVPVDGTVPGAVPGSVPGTGTVPGAAAPGGTAPGASAPGTTTGPGGTTTPGGSGTKGGATPPPATPGATAGDTTGVTNDHILIGIHAPVTGAAAIPSTSFERGIEAYFDYVNNRGGFHGRKVDVVFMDDQFRPDVAVQRCREMNETKKVFMVFGGAGSDQIEACARYAHTVAMPYLSAGVQERSSNGSLGDLSTYFALTLTYEQQAPIVARIAAEVAGSDGKVIIRVADNTSLDNYFATQASSLSKSLGSRFIYDGDRGRVPKNTQGGDAVNVATGICNSGAKVVVWNASPSSLLNVSASMPCTVTFVGPGLSNGLNIVANAGCPKLENARFLSPFPGMDVMRQNSEFMTAYAEKNGGAAPDDIAASIYAGEKLIGSVLQAVGRNLTRESFLATIAKQKVFKTGIYPPTNFSSRFGGTAMWHLRADCSKREYVTVGQVAR